MNLYSYGWSFCSLKYWIPFGSEYTCILVLHKCRRLKWELSWISSSSVFYLISNPPHCSRWSGIHIPVHTLIVALQISMKFWSTAWGEIKLEGKFVLYSGTVIPNVFKSNISKGLMRNLYQNRSYCIFNCQIIFVVDRNRNTFLMILIIVNFLVVHVAFSWRTPTV